MSLTLMVVQSVDVSKVHVFQRQLRTPQVTQTREDSNIRPVSTKLEVSGIGGAPPKQYTIEKEEPKSCAKVPPDDF